MQLGLKVKTHLRAGNEVKETVASWNEEDCRELEEKCNDGQGGIDAHANCALKDIYCDPWRN